MKQKTYRWTVAVLAATFALAGCGGGGGGGGNSGGGNNNGGGGGNGAVVTLTGQLKEQSQGYVLPNRVVAVKGTSSKGTSDANGRFSISSAPTGNITLVIKDNVGALNGEVPLNITGSGSGTRDVGVITLDLSRIPPPPF